MWGILGKPLKRAIWKTLGLLAVLTTCFRFSSVSDRACVACCLFLSTGSYHVRIQIHSTGCCHRCTTETFGARSGGVKWVQVSHDEPGRKAKKPRTAGSQQPACTHKDNQILTTAEAASFASQFWDRKVHPTKASQHEFLATCIDVGLEKNVKHAQWHLFIHTDVCCSESPRFLNWAFCNLYAKLVQFAALFTHKCDHLPPPPHPYIPETAFSHRFEKVQFCKGGVWVGGSSAGWVGLKLWTPPLL